MAQNFTSYEDLLAAVQALPGYVPSFAPSGAYTEEVFNSVLTRTAPYAYYQAVGTDGGISPRTCRVVTSPALEPTDWWLHLPVISETVEGFSRVTNMPAGQQPVEYQLASCAFELPSDADMTAYHAALSADPPTIPVLPRGCLFAEGTGAATDTNPIVSYHTYQIPAALTLGDVAAEWMNLPRFTAIETDTGFFATDGDNSSWNRMGGFTYDGQGITLAGSNTNPAKMPPGGIFATVDLVPQVPIEMSSGSPVIGGDGVPVVDMTVVEGNPANLMSGASKLFNLFIRVKITRTRPCDLDASNNEIRPYIDIDWDLTKKTD